MTRFLASLLSIAGFALALPGLMLIRLAEMADEARQSRGWERRYGDGWRYGGES